MSPNHMESIWFGDIHGGFAGLFETSCERIPGFEFANPLSLTPERGVEAEDSRVSGP